MKLALLFILLLPSANAQDGEPMVQIPKTLVQAMVERNEKLRSALQIAADEIARLQKALSTEKARSGCV